MASKGTAQRKSSLRESQKEHTRQRIIEVSHDLFGRQGYFATTVDQIVSAVGMSRPTFYVHFTDKGEILEALITSYTTRAANEMNTLPSPDPTFEDIYAWLMNIARFVENEKVMIALIAEVSADIRTVPSYVTATVKALVTALSQKSVAFATALQKGSAGAEARARSHLLLAQITWAANMYWTNKGNDTGKAAIRITAEALHAFMTDQRYHSKKD